MFERQRGDVASVRFEEQGIWKDEQRASSRLSHGGKGPRELRRTVHLLEEQLYPQGLGYHLDFMHPLRLDGWAVGPMQEDGDARYLGYGLFEEFESSPHDLLLQARDPRVVSPWMCQAGDEPVPHRIGTRYHDDRERARGRLGSLGGTDASRRHQDLDLEVEQVGDQLREPLDLSLCSAILNGEVLALHPAKVAEPVPEGLEIAFGLWGVHAGPEYADTAHLSRRLRHGEERRREQT